MRLYGLTKHLIKRYHKLGTLHRLPETFADDPLPSCRMGVGHTVNMTAAGSDMLKKVQSTRGLGDQLPCLASIVHMTLQDKSFG